MAREAASVAPAVAVLTAGLAACGSTSTTTPTALTSVTTADTLSTRQIPRPVLNVTQLGFRMAFPAQLGTVNYQIDGSGGGSTATYNGVSAQNPVEAQILVWDNTNASSLAGGPGGGPDHWVRAGANLLGFRNAPGFSGCGTNQLTLDLPLLREMFLTARAD